MTARSLAAPRRPNPLRYLAYARTALGREMAYRFNALVALAGFVAGVYVLQYVWRELYRTNEAVAPEGISLEDMLTYTVVGQLALIVVQADTTGQIRDKVRQGTVAIDLMRPASFPLYMLADHLGAALFRVFLVLPALAVGMALVDLQTPPTALHALAFVGSLALGFLVAFLLNFVVNMAAFWTLETFGLQLTIQFAGLVLSGAVVPIWFFPEWLADVARLLPFASVYGVPLSVYIGKLDGAALLWAMALQAFWVALLTAALWLVWRAAERRVVVQGG